MKTKVTVPTAQNNMSYFPMEAPHGTTAQFFRPTVPFCYEVIAGTNMELRIGAMRRIDPMVVPPLSMVNFNTRFFYVPYIDICPYYHDLKAQTPYSFRYAQDEIGSHIPANVPQIMSGVILDMFLNNTTRISSESEYADKSPAERSKMLYSFEVHGYNPYKFEGDIEDKVEQIQEILNHVDIYRHSHQDPTSKVVEGINPYQTSLILSMIEYIGNIADDVQDKYTTDAKALAQTYVEYVGGDIDSFIEAVFEEAQTEAGWSYWSGEDKMIQNISKISSFAQFLMENGFDPNASQAIVNYDDTFYYGIPDYLINRDDAPELYRFTESCDFSVNEYVLNTGSHSTGYSHYYKYTERGRNAYKLLKQTGYDYENLHIGQGEGVPFSALKLLAFVKVMLDYYENSAFINNTERLQNLNSLIHIDVDNYYLSVDDLDLIMDLTMYMTYERDYFTVNMVNPIAGNEFMNNGQSIQIADPTVSRAHVVTNDANGTPTHSSTNTNEVISATGNKLLARLTDYMKRMQIAGGRFVDRILAEFGISVDNENSRRTSYIDTINSKMTITPVMNTTSDELGDYAGFGWSSNDGNNNTLNISVPKEDGVIIAIDTITPEIMYSQGYNRQNRHIGVFDFVTPDFDGIMPQITEQGELLMIKKGPYHYGISGEVGSEEYEVPSDKSFGHNSKYMENKTLYGVVTGDFICPSVNLDISGYFTNRELNPADYLKYPGSSYQIAITQSRAFSASYDQEQYSRIFYYHGNEEELIGKTDYIKSIFRFEIKMHSPQKSPFDNYEFDKVGPSIEMEVTGQTMH